MAQKMSSWRAGLLWNFAVVIVGSFVAFLLVFVPFIICWINVYGLNTRPSEFTLRMVQIVEAIVMYPSGGWLSAWYFKNRIDAQAGSTRWAWRWGLGFAIFLAVFAIAVASLHYGSARNWPFGMWVNFAALFSANAGGLLLSTRYFHPGDRIPEPVTI